MRQAFKDLTAVGYQLPAAVDPNWLILGNVRTDIPTLEIDFAEVPWWRIARMIWIGSGCSAEANHPAHSMRCRKQSVAEAYHQMREVLCDGLKAGCNPELDWQTRALRFGSAMHTLQDSYALPHCSRIDNGDPHSAIIDMHTYPSRQHPIQAAKDDIWQDHDKTALRPEAAASVTATVAALKMFASQSLAELDRFLQNYVAFREDIATIRQPR